MMMVIITIMIIIIINYYNDNNTNLILTIIFDKPQSSPVLPLLSSCEFHKCFLFIRKVNPIWEISNYFDYLWLGRDLSQSLQMSQQK